MSMVTQDPELDKLLTISRIQKDTIPLMVQRFLVLATLHDQKNLLQYVHEINTILDSWKKELQTAYSLKMFINGVSSYYLTKFIDADSHLNTALENTPNNAHNIEGIIRMLLGANYRSMGEMDLAVKNLLKAQQLIEPNGIFHIYYIIGFYQLGEIHIAIKEYDNAIHYYTQAEKNITANTETPVKFRIYSGLAIGYMHLKSYDLSTFYINKALSDPDILIKNKARGYFDLGMLLSHQNKHNEAIEYYTKSHQIREENNLEDASSTSLIYLSRSYLQTNQPEKALTHLTAASTIVEKFKVKSKQIELLHLLAQTHSMLCQYDKSVKYYDQYTLLKEEEHTEQERRIFQFKKSLIEQQRQELETKNHLLKNTLNELATLKRNRLATIYSFATVIILVILTELFFDPYIDTFAYDTYLSLAIKVGIALLLKPIDSIYEYILYKKTLKKNNQF